MDKRQCEQNTRNSNNEESSVDEKWKELAEEKDWQELWKDFHGSDKPVLKGGIEVIYPDDGKGGGGFFPGGKARPD
jgi:hypothetical protein